MTTRFASIVVLLGLLNLNAVLYAQIHISGPQSGVLIDTVYIVNGEISVEQSDSLFIEPGATLLFGPYEFTIKGFLRAMGTESDSIIFMPDSGHSWRGIYFDQSSSDSCLLKYCLIEGSNDDGIEIHQCGPTIDHCTIRRNSSGGIWEGGIYVTSQRNTTISNCIITENSGSAGGGIGTFGALLTIRNCIITRNTSTDEGAGINLEMWLTSAIIDHCLIANNISENGGGINVCSGAIATINNCTIVGNSSLASRGGGICAGSCDSSTQIVNVILANNIGGGIELGSLIPETIISYGCFYQNQEGNFVGSAHDSLGFPMMVNANGDSCDVFQNIFLDPMFVDVVNGDYHLLEASPCIDAGDPESPLDPDSTIADIGAFYYHQFTGINSHSNTQLPVEFQLLQNYPNPFNATTVIRYDVPSAAQISVKVYNILGQQVVTLFEGMQPAGYHTVAWDATDFPSGIYFAYLQTNNHIKTIKMLLIK